MMPVSIIIPSYNGLELLKECLLSILNFVDFNSGHELTVVDDGSVDTTVPFLREHFPRVSMIALKKNCGFAKASTEGILQSKNRIIALINNDVSVDHDFLSPLLKNFVEEDVFAVGLKVMKKQGSGHYHLGSKAHFEKGEITIIRDREGKGETFYVSGGMALFDKEKFLELGGFDDLYYPFYWEDVDLCYRALKKGYRILYEPSSVIYHQDQGTIVFSKKGRCELFFAKMYARIIQERNQYLFTWKNILDRDLIVKHAVWILPNLILSFRNKDHIFKPLGFLLALLRLKKALHRRKEEKGKHYLRKDHEIFSSNASSRSSGTCPVPPVADRDEKEPGRERGEGKGYGVGL